MSDLQSHVNMNLEEGAIQASSPVRSAPKVKAPKVAASQTTPLIQLKDIDIVDIARLFWSIRLFIVAGVIAGVGFGLLAPGNLIPLKYRSEVPVDVVFESLPAITEPKQLVSHLNNALSSSYSAGLLHESFMAKVPEYKKRHGDGNSNVFEIPSSLKPLNWPIHAVALSGAEQLYLSLNLPLKADTGEEILAALQDGLDRIIATRNERSVESIQILKVSDVERTKVAQNRVKEIAAETGKSVRQNLQQISAQLHSYYFQFLRDALDLPDGAQLLSSTLGSERIERSQMEANSRTPIRELAQTASRKLGETLELASLLTDRKKMSQQDFETFMSRHAKLQFELSQTVSELEISQRYMESGMNAYSHSLLESLVPINPEEVILPRLQVVQALSSSQTTEPSPKSILVSSTALSVFLFLIVGLVTRLASILKLTENDKSH